ncbi:MAG: DUF3108 domain-containing protein [Bacteroidota bacterium]|nr:DUF3108 domain-containing protein [Bacteroidota bacterium]MDP4232817.1 DUF3108 domain-containing protein [Bacteroidota bacterium]MDP4242502.1 DUF3108 domain-containing protein [Bacteroidota bacterium]MDP4289020.1 DUF3108 domain-containing protein [Bacteroidota bacterium]
MALIVLALAASVATVAAIEAPDQSAVADQQFRSWPNNAFTVGERLSFDISYGFITAGHAVMSIPAYRYVNGRKTYETRIEASSTSGFDWVFKVRDRYETFMDVDGIFPWRFEQHVREGNYSKDYDAFFDPVSETAETSDGNHYKIPKYVHDIVSAFYYVRTLDLTHSRRGDVIHLQNFYDGQTHPLDVRILGHQKVETDAGTFECAVVEPMVVQGGLFKSEGSIKIWLTDDDNHLPVKMTSKVIIGEITATLTKYEGARGPVTAKTE